MYFMIRYDFYFNQSCLGIVIYKVTFKILFDAVVSFKNLSNRRIVQNGIFMPFLQIIFCVVSIAFINLVLNKFSYVHFVILYYLPFFQFW